MNRRKKQDEKRRDRNPFIRWVMGSVSVILIGSASFAMLMFGNDSVFRVTQEQKNSAGDIQLPVTYSQEKITVPKKDNDTLLGNVGTSGVDDDKPIAGISSGPINLSTDAQAIKDKLSGTEYADKAEAFASAYDTLKTVLGGSNVNVESMAIGLMANLASEGNFGVVEYAFSKNHPYGFYLPSGDSFITTTDDMEYLLAWDSTTNTGSKPYKGSCGVGSVQWSYGRRIGFLNVAKQIMPTDSDINDSNWALAESLFIGQEMEPSGAYFSKLQKYLEETLGTDVTSASPEDWAEAIMKKYEAPGNNDVSGRRAHATTIYNYLK